MNVSSINETYDKLRRKLKELLDDIERMLISNRERPRCELHIRGVGPISYNNLTITHSRKCDAEIRSYIRIVDGLSRS